MSHWEAMLSHPNEWVEQWHILRPDADFRDVTKSSEDTLQASNSYNVTRSSPDDDGETSDDDGDDDQSSQDIGPKSVLVFPDKEPVTAVNQEFQPGRAATFPRQAGNKGVIDMDEYQFRTLTLENTKMNRGDGETVLPLKTTGTKKVGAHVMS